ncbi:hypothetical protein OAP06_02870 [Gammaproteobacteria bacterium]|nr:hypothetical protein [Gammaproteobacteria bacterium]
MSFFKKALGAAVGYKVYKNHQPPTIVPPPEMVIVGIEKKGVLGSGWRIKYKLRSNMNVTHSFSVTKNTSGMTIGSMKVGVYWN